MAYPPKVSISSLANALKGISAFYVRRDYSRELRLPLRGDSFLTPAFFPAQCGGAPPSKL